MQRQSLGSPVSKLHFHGGSDDAEVCDNSATSSLSPPPPSLLLDSDDRRLKTAKLPSRRLSTSASSSSSPTPTPEKLIHLIPIILLSCFLILYLASNNPSQSSNNKTNPTFSLSLSSIEIDSAVADSKLGELRAREVMPIRSFRNLHETAARDARRMSSSQHRKFAGL
ncbi:unnamed protein product [Linum tenue]|uniref:Uncharacterized protein n=1 Tax=Linum tenue TaxID=586396 RepID=A0AAV0PL14_9ROSI|nr:unnamed protein product [Linum tenue]